MSGTGHEGDLRNAPEIPECKLTYEGLTGWQVEADITVDQW